MRVDQPLDTELALSGGRESLARAQSDLGPLERHVELAVKLECPTELLDCGVLVSFCQRALADRLGEGRERIGVATGRHARERVGTGVGIRTVAVRSEEAGRPPHTAHRVVPVLASLPAREKVPRPRACISDVAPRPLRRARVRQS